MRINVKRYFSLLVCVLLSAVCLAPYAVAADMTSQANGEINLENIYELAYKANTDSKIADLRLKQLYDSIEDIQDALKDAREAARSADPLISQYGKNALIALFGQQITDETKKSTELSVELTKRQLALGGQALLASYYSVIIQNSELELSAGKLERGLKSAKIMQQLGMVTSDAVAVQENSLNSVRGAAIELQSALSDLKSQIGFYIGTKETVLTISPFEGTPSADATEILSSINYDEDLKAAQKNSFAIKIQTLIAEDSSNKQRGIDSLKLDKLRAELPAKLKKAHSNLSVKAAALENAESAYALSKRGLEIAELKYKLGMISKNSHQDSVSDLAAKENALTSAQLDFITFLYTYRAMVNGVG